MRISDWSSDVCSSDLNASVRYSPSEDWSLAANFRHQSTPDRNIENNSTSLCDTFYCVSTFSFVDLKATKRFGAFAISAGIDNLLDEKALDRKSTRLNSSH